ncbi:MAG: hypothetical protein A4E29_00641 [Methanomassiliicoccales archaeon PtaB.Bin134]|nr:MAG: hypothetical protein A4E29_00641 [Methanomassiliicoccales archaeon PtaB.Bin134]
MMAAALGVGPALALMFYTLRDYTYPQVERPFFDDRKLFLMLAVGMVIGVVVYVLQSYFDLGFILFALLFAVLEELIKLVILNMPRFSRKLDTSFYGFALGLGIGSTMAFGAVFYTMQQSDMDLLAWITVLVLAVQMVLLHASTGALIGTGSARGEMWGYFAQAGLVHIGFNLLMAIPLNFDNIIAAWAGVILATLLVAYYYLQVHRHLLPSVVKDALAAMKQAKA